MPKELDSIINPISVPLHGNTIGSDNYLGFEFTLQVFHTFYKLL